MTARRSATVRTLFVAVGVLAVAHGVYGFTTHHPSDSPCHFCAITPGLAVPFLEVLLGPSVAAVGATVSGGPGFPVPDFRFESPERSLLRVGAALPAVVLVFGALSAGYGFVLAFPLVLVGWLLVVVGVGIRVWKWRRKRSRDVPEGQE